MNFLAPLYEKLQTMWTSFVKLLPMIGLGLIMLLLTWVVARIAGTLLKKSLAKSHLRKALRELFATLLRTLIWSVGILISITIIFPSLTPAKLLAALGLGSVATADRDVDARHRVRRAAQNSHRRCDRQRLS